MAYRKRHPGRIVSKAGLRLSALESIDTAKGKIIDYGRPERPLTSTILKAQIRRCEELTEKYNAALMIADEAANKLQEAEKTLANMCVEVLSAVKGKFGRDSSELEIAGGKRLSERKKWTRKT